MKHLLLLVMLGSLAGCATVENPARAEEEIRPAIHEQVAGDSLFTLILRRLEY